MSKNAIRPVGTLAVALLFATGLALAKSKTQKTEVDLSRLSKIGSIQALKPGTYSMELMQTQTGQEALFYQDGKLVAETPAEVVQEPQRNDNTAVVYDMGQPDEAVVTEIRPEGWKERIDFPKS